MKLMTKNGQEVELGPGCIIGFFLNDRVIVLEIESDRICWPNKNGDDKICMPDFLQDEKDCMHLAFFISELFGTMCVPVERPYGPAFLLKARVNPNAN